MNKLLQFYHKNIIFRGVLIVVVIISISVLGYMISSLVSGSETKELKNNTQEDLEKKEKLVLADTKFRRAIDGVFVENEDEIFSYPIAVMVENFPDSRPTSGLSEAPLVWEAPVEGGITRFLAFYLLDQEVQEIGPIRSARPYFIDWLKPLNAVYAHVGGSPESLKNLKNYENDFDQFYNGKYFFRSPYRKAPHDVYSSSYLLKLFFRDKDFALKNEFDQWLFKDDLELDERPMDEQSIVIDYSTFQYKVEWRYDRDINDYVRYLAGKKHKDDDGNRITAKNVVVLFTDMEIIDDKLRKKITTIGSGKALIFQDGNIIKGEWEKESADKRIRFFNEHGEEIRFNAGNTWVQVVPEGMEIVY